MARTKPEDFKVEDFYFLKIKNMWRYFWSEHPAFWCICGYLFIEYVRPQSILPILNILPWAQLFLLGSLALSFFDKKSILEFSSLHILVGAFTILIHISILFSYDASWSKYYYIFFIQWVIVFFLITKIITTKTRLYIFLFVFWISTLKLALGTAKIWIFRGFEFTSYGINGPPGYFQNSGELSIQMIIFFCFSYYLTKYFWSGLGKLGRVFMVAATIAPILTIMGASSRGSQIALAVVILIMFWKNIFSKKLIIIIPCIILTYVYILPDQQKARFETIGDDGTSVQRLIYWERGIDMILSNPITGVGYYNFIPYFTNYYPQDMAFVDASGNLVAELPHNILIQVGTDAGLPALLCILILFLISTTPKLKESYLGVSLEKGIILGILGFIIGGQFVTIMYYPFYWVSLSLLCSTRRLYK